MKSPVCLSARSLLLAATTASLLAVPSMAGATPASQHRPPHGALSITSFGALPDDDVDDLAAIVQTIDAAKLSGKSVYVPRGTFLYSDLITLDGVDLAGAGPCSILKSTDAANQAVELTGSGASVANVALTTIPVTERLSTPASTRVSVMPGATNFRVSGVRVDGGSSGGIFSRGSNGTIVGNLVKNTLADGIHLTNGSADVVVTGNQVRDTGDDQIAVVSYETGGEIARNITITRNSVSGGHARGITVSGGENVLVEANKVARTGGAGIFLASEGSWGTYTVTNVRVVRNSVTADSQNPAVPERGGIRLQATNKEPSITGVVIERNRLADSASSGVLIVGSAAVHASFTANEITNPAAYGIRIVSTVTGSLSFSANTVTGSAQAPFSNASTATVVTDMPNDPDAAGGGTGDVYVAGDGTPVVDGVVDARWSNSSALALNVDPNGTTGTARIMWDETNLYYLFEITDLTPFATSVNERNDSVEVWVDELSSRNGARTVGDYQMRVDLLGAVSTSMIEGMDFSSVQSAVTTGVGTYTVELAVPYFALVPQAGAVIGFNASANDDANGDGIRDTYLSWVDKELPYWADTRAYGSVTLIDQP